MKNKAPRQNAHLHNKNPSPACGRGVGVRAFVRRTNPAFTPLGEASVYPAWCVANPKFCTEKSLPPLAGDGAPMKKMLAFFSWVPGKVAEGRKGG